MAQLKTSYQGTREGIARATAKELRISPKESYEVANAIRGKPLQKAKSFLERVLKLEEAVPYRRFNRGGTGHRKGKMGPGRYPRNTSIGFLALLNEVESNADFKGLNTDKLRITHVATHRGQIIQGRYKGSPSNKPTTHVEVVVAEDANIKVNEKKTATEPKKEKKAEAVKETTEKEVKAKEEKPKEAEEKAESKPKTEKEKEGTLKKAVTAVKKDIKPKENA